MEISVLGLFFCFLNVFPPLVCVVKSCHVVLTKDVKIEAVGLRGAAALLYLGIGMSCSPGYL